MMMTIKDIIYKILCFDGHTPSRDFNNVCIVCGRLLDEPDGDCGNGCVKVED
jgi:hypothetical protein